jgi:Uncharacterized protein conserved in bacteria
MPPTKIKKTKQLSELKKLVAEQSSSKKKRAHKVALKTAQKKTAPATKNDIDFPRTMLAQQVKPLPPPRKAALETPRVPPVPRQRLHDENEVLALAKYGEEPKPSEWEIGQEWENDQSFLRPGISGDVLRKLRRSHWVIQSEIDLHGMISDEAHDALVDFLVEARRRGLRCVRVVHGKGLTSPGKTPVLKHKVRRWLTLWNDVLAYCEPPQHGGGSGAVVVLLRGR